MHYYQGKRLRSMVRSLLLSERVQLPKTTRNPTTRMDNLFRPFPIIFVGFLCFISSTSGDDDDNGCLEPLGIQSGEFNDGEISASSMLKNFTATDAWCPPKNDENQYIQVDLSRKTEVTKLATQGQSGDKDRHVKTYALLYSNDGNKWEQYTEKGKEKIFDANKDSFTVNHNVLDKPLITRYLRINPRSWENAICLRLEVFGCDV